MKSSFLSLKTRDFIKALAVAVLAPVITIIIQTVDSGSLTFDWLAIIRVSISAAGGYLLKNLFTDDVKAAEKVLGAEDQAQQKQRNKMKDQPFDKKFVMLVLLSFSFLCGSAQSFFKPLPKTLKTTQIKGRATTLAAASPASFWAIRPIASAVTMFIGDAVEAAAGGGISYQNITEQADGRFYVNYAFSALMLAGGSVTPSQPSDVGKFGLMVSALNNTIGVGYGISKQEDPVTHDKNWKGGLMIAWTVNFNN